MSFILGARSIDAFMKCPRRDGSLDDPGLVIAGERLVAQSNPYVVQMEMRGEVEIRSPGTDRDYSRPAKGSKGARLWLNSSMETSPSLSTSPIPHFRWHFATLEDHPTLIHSMVNRSIETAKTKKGLLKVDALCSSATGQARVRHPRQGYLRFVPPGGAPDRPLNSPPPDLLHPPLDDSFPFGGAVQPFYLPRALEAVVLIDTRFGGLPWEVPHRTTGGGSTTEPADRAPPL
jgi:hypothetical protein